MIIEQETAGGHRRHANDRQNIGDPLLKAIRVRAPTWQTSTAERFNLKCQWIRFPTSMT